MRRELLATAGNVFYLDAPFLDGMEHGGGVIDSAEKTAIRINR